MTFTGAGWDIYSGDAINFATDDATRNYTLKAIGDALYLSPVAKGLILILR